MTKINVKIACNRWNILNFLFGRMATQITCFSPTNTTYSSDMGQCIVKTSHFCYVVIDRIPSSRSEYVSTKWNLFWWSILCLLYFLWYTSSVLLRKKYYNEENNYGDINHIRVLCHTFTILVERVYNQWVYNIWGRRVSSLSDTGRRIGTILMDMLRLQSPCLDQIPAQTLQLYTKCVRCQINGVVICADMPYWLGNGWLMVGCPFRALGVLYRMLALIV